MILPRYSLFAAMLAAAGLPIYLHAPKFYADEYGVSLAALGLLLLALRLVDFVQDPLLGWLAGRLEERRALAALTGTAGLALGMLGLFALAPPLPPLVWMSLCLVLLFTCYSFLTILFYARGIGQARQIGDGGHVRLAGWREAGSLAGVSLASMAPTLLGMAGLTSPFATFALLFAGLALVAALAMHPVWPGRMEVRGTGFGPLLRDRQVRLLLVVALFNAAPMAVTATLFLFYVEYRLGAPDMSGPLLLAFFISAGIGAPLFAAAARRFGTVKVLAAGMALSIVSFSFAWQLGDGDLLAFAVVCLGSGLALGGDLTLLPALFAERVSDISGSGEQAFGLWSFCAKLAFAAGALALTALEGGGFAAGAENSASALQRLSFLYALLPCILKALALGLLGYVFFPRKEAA